MTDTTTNPQTFCFADLALLSDHTTAQVVFHEAINFAANFGIDDGHAGLQHLIDQTTKESQLCAPTALADFMVYRMGVSKTLPISHKVPGVSHDLKSIDVNLLVADLARRCKTDPITATSGEDLIAAIGPAMHDYFGKSVKVNLVFGSNDKGIKFPSYVHWTNEQLDFLHIIQALQQANPVLMRIKHVHYEGEGADMKTSESGGHFFPIYGYARQDYFGNNLLQLAITDTAPITSWVINNIQADYNAVSAFRDNAGDGGIFLDGRGFNGQASRAFLGFMLTIEIL